MNHSGSRDLAIILRTYPSRESDLVTHLLCQRLGKVSALARGARRSKRRFLSGLDVFDRGVVEIRPARGSLQILDSMSPEGGFRSLRDGLTSLSAGSLLLEAFDSMTVEGDTSDSEKFFEVLDLSLSGLNTASRSADKETLLQALQNGLAGLLEVSGVRVPSAAHTSSSPRVLTSLVQEVEGHSGRALRSAEGILPLLFS